MCGYVFTLLQDIIITMLEYRDEFSIYIVINVVSLTLIVVTIHVIGS